jgi:membrane protein DedA with SNARE-associated domain
MEGDDLKAILGAVVAWITGVILAMGWPGIVLLMAIESACIPLPSEVIMPFAGYLASKGLMNFHAASWAGAFGCAVGSAVAYYVGYVGGRPMIERYGKYILLRMRDLDRADAFFARHGDAAIFWSRLMPVIRTFISLPAGISRMPFGKFIVLSFAGSLPWCYFLAWIGLTLGRHSKDFAAVHARIAGYFHGVDIVIGVVLLALFGVFVWHHLKPEPEETAAGK